MYSKALVFTPLYNGPKATAPKMPIYVGTPVKPGKSAK